MTREVTCVDVEDEIGHVAWLMAQRDLKHVPVLQGASWPG
jgi:predicted transcriptional regulator